MNPERFVAVKANADTLEIAALGDWTAENAGDLEGLTDALPPSRASRVTIDMSEVRAFDTYGAWALERFVRADGRAREVTLRGLPERFRGLYDKIRQTNRRAAPTSKRGGWPATQLEVIGRRIFDFGSDGVRHLSMIGALAATSTATVAAPRTFRFTSFVYQLDRVGLRSVPIISLITLLIGAIVAQQGIFYFRKFGADDYVVDLVAILVLRELGVLLVSIMVAGRSGSSYTAELGSMKMREEIDALRTMGRDPMAVLILPRVLALTVALPLLTLIGAAAALCGGGLVAWFYGGMDPSIFIARLRDAVSISDFEVGLIKSPFMALMIGVVACTEGLKVEGSAESLGLRTTASVVKSIFMVIVLDGIFAMFFSSIGM